jgi:integrase
MRVGDMRAVLSDRMIATLPNAVGSQYAVRDTELKGFQVVIGVRRKTFAVQGEYWKDGKRTGCRLTLGHFPEMNTREARVAAKLGLALIAKGEVKPKRQAAATGPRQITLRTAWNRYRDSHMIRKGRSEATIEGYRDHVERVLADWLDTPLAELASNPRLVADRHDELTRRSGPYAANGAMRTLRAIYNHARKTARELPADNPAYGVDWNREIRRDTAMGAKDLPRWFTEAGRLRHPIRREFHLFMLLSGSRPGALMRAKIEDLDIRRRVLHIPRPKGGAERAFDIPLSRAMICCLMRVMRIGRMLHPEAAQTWIFAADSAEGHLVEHKEPRTKLFKWGNDLRQTYRTLGHAVGLSRLDMHLLMNHSVPGVNEGYITRDRLLEDQLRTSQERLSKFILAQAVTARRKWPHVSGRRIGDPMIDPTPPDPRVALHFKRRPLSPFAQSPHESRHGGDDGGEGVEVSRVHAANSGLRVRA